MSLKSKMLQNAKAVAVTYEFTLRTLRYVILRMKGVIRKIRDAIFGLFAVWNILVRRFISIAEMQKHSRLEAEKELRKP